MCGKEMVSACWDFFSFLITYLSVQKRRLLKFGTSHDDLTNREITAVNQVGFQNRLGIRAKSTSPRSTERSPL